MLKPAVEMARVSSEVMGAATTREQGVRGESSLDTQKALLEEQHHAFSLKAFAAARAGEQAVVMPGHELSISRLNEEGFDAKRLTRRSEFEIYLAKLCESKREEVARACGRVMLSFEDLINFEDDGMYHRNSLLSLFETLWRNPSFRDSLDIDLVFSFVRINDAAKTAELERVRPLLEKALFLFLEQKRVEAKYEAVCWENLTVPIAEDAATFVSWESVDDGGGLVENFSAQRLKWLVTSWPEVSKIIGEWVEDAANEGKSYVELLLHRGAKGWRITDCCPLGSSESSTDDEGDDESLWDDDSENSFPFCAPSLVATELELIGYTVFVEPVTSDFSENASDPASQNILIERKMKIVWAGLE